MRNKRGEGYIGACVMVVILCMLIAVFVTFMTAVSIRQICENNSRIVLDNFVMKNSIKIYDSIKNGNDFTKEFNEEEYIDDLCDFCTLEKNGHFLYAYDDEGKIKYTMSIPEVSFALENTLKIYTSYTLYIPIEFGGVVIDTAEIPVKVESKFNEKF